MLTRFLSLAFALPLMAATLIAAHSAHAQSSLGIQGLRVDFGYGMTDSGQTVTSGISQVNVNITNVHGLQLDIGLIDGGQILTGQLGAHLYMQPVNHQKYGLFAVVSDTDGEAIQYGTAGVEGRIALSDTLALEGRFGMGGTTGMGGTSASQWDYVFLGGGALYVIGPHTALEARVDITEFDEMVFRAVGVDSQLRLSHRLGSSNFGVFGEARHTALYGDNAMPAITTLGLGLSLDLGRSSHTLMDRPFHVPNPFDQLVQRGIVVSF